MEESRGIRDTIAEPSVATECRSAPSRPLFKSRQSRLARDGRTEKREARNMAERFRKHGDAYFQFITTPAVGLTNNAAQRALRFFVKGRHVTPCTGSGKGRQANEQLWRVIATCALQDRSAFEFIRRPAPSDGKLCRAIKKKRLLDFWPSPAARQSVSLSPPHVRGSETITFVHQRRRRGPDTYQKGNRLRPYRRLSRGRTSPFYFFDGRIASLAAFEM